jgi:hypothetical protein
MTNLQMLPLVGIQDLHARHIGSLAAGSVKLNDQYASFLMQ